MEAKQDPYAFIQYKGTDICMDFHCDCGAHCHHDGYFAHVVQCPHCKTNWKMPDHVTPRRLLASDYPHEPQVMQYDEDIGDPSEDDDA